MKRVGERQRWVWLASGLSAVTAVKACGLSWAWVLGASFLTVLYYIYMERRLRPCGLGRLIPAAFGPLGKWLGGLSLLWTVLCLAWSANLADWAFPLHDGYPILGWVLLAVCAWGCRKGPAPSARCAGVVFLCLAGLYGLLCGFALGDVRPAHLRPVGTWRDGVTALGLLLLGTAVWYAPSRRTKRVSRRPALLLSLALGVLVFLTSGVLGPDLAKAQPAPFYAMARSVRLFGVLERVEPLASAAMTLGTFCLLSALACAAQSLGQGLGMGTWTGPAACVLAMALMGPVRQVNASILAMGGAVFWVMIPILAVEIERKA